MRLATFLSVATCQTSPLKGWLAACLWIWLRPGGIPQSQIHLDNHCFLILCWDLRDCCLPNSKSKSKFAVQEHQLEALSTWNWVRYLAQQEAGVVERGLNSHSSWDGRVSVFPFDLLGCNRGITSTAILLRKGNDWQQQPSLAAFWNAKFKCWTPRRWAILTASNELPGRQQEAQELSTTTNGT